MRVDFRQHPILDSRAGSIQVSWWYELAAHRLAQRRDRRAIPVLREMPSDAVRRFCQCTWTFVFWAKGRQATELCLCLTMGFIAPALPRHRRSPSSAARGSAALPAGVQIQRCDLNQYPLCIGALQNRKTSVVPV